MNPQQHTIYLQQMAKKVQNGYLEAFKAQTGLLPAQVAMLYGEDIVEERGHLVKKFRVRFVPADTATEMQRLLADNALLTRKNQAMQMVISPLSIKAGISEEALMELLKAAEAQLVGEPVGDGVEDAELVDTGAAPQEEVAGFERDPAI